MLVKRSRASWIMVYIILLVYLCSKCDILGEYGLEYGVLLCGYIVVGALFLYAVIYRKADIFEPLPMFLLLFIGLFSIAPIVITAKGTTELAGVNFMNGCIKVTTLYIFASIAFTWGYYRGGKATTIYAYNKKCIDNHTPIFFILLGIWTICLLLGFWFQYKVRGMSYRYILTLGSEGNFNKNETTDSSVNFILNFSYSTIVPWLYFVFYYKSNLTKIITTFCMVTLFIVCGWRNVIIIMGLAAMCVFFVKNNKRPTINQISIALIIGVIFLGILGAARGSLRNGVSVDKELFSFDKIVYNVFYALETNFNLYQPFYAIAMKYPSEYMYTFGKAIIIDTIVTIIPRAIWLGKPLAFDNALNLAIRRSTDDIVVKAYAMAVPSIGEMYVDFGIIGTTMLCGLLGSMTRKIARLYQKPNKDFIDLINYGVFFGVLFVLIMRGCMPNNFYYVVFLMWPNWLVRFLSKKRKDRKDRVTEN